MAKAIYNRKHLIRDLFTVSEGYSMAVMVEIMTTGRHSDEVVTKSYFLIYSQQGGGGTGVGS